MSCCHTCNIVSSAYWSAFFVDNLASRSQDQWFCVLHDVAYCVYRVSWAKLSGSYIYINIRNDVSYIYEWLRTPLNDLPCSFQSGFICCLRTEILLYAITAASRAFTPDHGDAAA